jgi:TonB family protein
MGFQEKANGPILSQSLFNTVHLPRSSWRSYSSSGVAHAVLILALLSITIPALKEQPEKRNVQSAVLIAPQLPEYRPKIIPPPHTRIQTPPLAAKTEVPPPKLVRPMKPIEVKPVETPKPQVMAAAPEIKNLAPAPTVSPVTEPKLAPAPRPAVRTGAFQAVDLAKGPTQPKVTKLGGFGDPNGVPPSTSSRPSQAMMARLGSFDLPEGGGRSGGGGQSTAGGVRQTSFGNGGEAAVNSGSAHPAGTVKTGAFGETPINAAQTTPAARKQIAEPAFTPVEILSKPKPAYSQEARDLKLEGRVSLDVVFLATGSIKIVRVVHGLGHGLDEAAEQAAQRVRFRPATRGGVPVDTNATIYITFELT